MRFKISAYTERKKCQTDLVIQNVSEDKLIKY